MLLASQRDQSYTNSYGHTENTQFFSDLLGVATPKVINAIAVNSKHPTVLMNIIEQVRFDEMRFSYNYNLLLQNLDTKNVIVTL